MPTSIPALIEFTWTAAPRFAGFFFVLKRSRLQLRELGEACVQLRPKLPIAQLADLAAATIAVDERERAANLREVAHGITVRRSRASGKQVGGV